MSTYLLTHRPTAARHHVTRYVMLIQLLIMISGSYLLKWEGMLRGLQRPRFPLDALSAHLQRRSSLIGEVWCGGGTAVFPPSHRVCTTPSEILQGVVASVQMRGDASKGVAGNEEGVDAAVCGWLAENMGSGERGAGRRENAASTPTPIFPAPFLRIAPLV
uniref:Uncharacterized protein n=1 Tax=Heliothis virescens TaxID=7102 RepID=A0A2A4K229_HELVI